jgi:hypothetical protein
LIELTSELLTEVDTNSMQHYLIRDEILSLEFPEKIPIRGKLAYLRYEPALPELKKENRNFLFLQNTPPEVVFRLDMQEALLGKVTPSLRHVSIGANPDQKKLTAHFIYDGEISALNYKLATAAIQESKISFPDYEIDSLIERIDFPNELPIRGTWLAYWRQEWIFGSDAPVAAIPYK